MISVGLRPHPCLPVRRTPDSFGAGRPNPFSRGEGAKKSLSSREGFRVRSMQRIKKLSRTNHFL